MRINNNCFKIVFLLLLVINSFSVRAESQLSVGFDQERIIPAKFKSDANPVLYVKKGDTYLSKGKITKVKLDASEYLESVGATYPTQIKIKISKLDLDTGKETWLRTSTKLVTSLPHASKLFLDLDLGSFLSKYNEEFVFRLYDEQGILIQEYNQAFTAENFNPDFKPNLDQDFTACISKESTVECVYETLGSIMIKQVHASKTENYFARNNDGSLVMTMPTLDVGNFVRKKKKGNKKKPGSGKVNNSPVDQTSEGTKGIGKFSTITSNASHYHGYTEHLSKFTFLATSWDPAHPYKNPSLYGDYSAVFGRNNKTSNSSIIAGEDNFTTTYSAVFGRTNTGNSSYSLIAGQDNYVDSSYTLVSGKNNEVENAAGSLVVGYNNDVNGEYASAVGHVNKIEGQGSHIWGSGITVNGDNSFAFGYGNTTNPTVITGDKKIAFVYGTETIMMIDGVNGSVSFGGANGAPLTGNFEGTFNGTFIGDGSGIRNISHLGPSLTFVPGTTAANDITFQDLVTFNGPVIFNDTVRVSSCILGDFLLATANGSLQCTNFAGAVASAISLNAIGANGSVQYKFNGVMAGSDALRVTNNGNGLFADIVETPRLIFPGVGFIMGDASFSDNIDFVNNVVLNDSFTIPSCTTAGFVLVNDVAGKFSCVDPGTVMSGGGGGGNGGSLAAAGINGSIQFRTDGLLTADHVRLQYTDLTFKAQAITGVTMPIKSAPATVSINWSEGNQQEIRLTQNDTTINISLNPAGPATVMMQLVHNTNIGVKTITWPTNFKFSDGSPPILSTQASAVDFVSCFFNPTNGAGGTYYCQASYNFF